MIAELLDTITSWRTALVVLLVFGPAPRAVLRLIVLAFRRDDPRRRELLAELHAVPRRDRPAWVLEQFEVAFVEGLLPRLGPSQRIAIVQGALALLIVGGFAVGYQQLMLERQQDKLVVRAELTGGGSIVSKDVRYGLGSREP
jgi:hypothetical protein